MNHQEVKSYLQVATQVAEEGGKVLTKYWGRLSNISKKSFTWDLVTEADQESEEVILQLLTELYPSHAILAEESGLKQAEESEYLWVVDPLDGTTNYTHQYPMVCVSVALMFQNEIIAGVVYNPILNEMFQAGRGLGSTLNQQAIQVSETGALDHSLLATGFGYDRKQTADTNYPEFCHLTHCSQGVRRGGSAALDLAYVAAGRLDGCWERGLYPWDMAAGVILIEEAGGKVTSYEGSPLVLESGRLMASNGHIHQEMIKELRAARNKPEF
ncbi:MAG: inositol monophosphatase family protein [Waddliaceae bacterium]